MFEQVFRQSHHLLAVAIHLLTFSFSWFLLLTTLDVAWYSGCLMTYHVLLREGRTADQLATISPVTCAGRFRQALRSNCVLVVVAWIVLYYYHRETTLPWGVVTLVVLFLLALFVAFFRNIRLYHIPRS